jgi:hypothetical protein
MTLSMKGFKPGPDDFGHDHLSATFGKKFIVLTGHAEWIGHDVDVLDVRHRDRKPWRAPVRKRPCDGKRKPRSPSSNIGTDELKGYLGMSSWRRGISVLVLVLTSVGLTLPAQAADAPQHVVSIAQARTLPLDTVVTVHGTATTPSGAFESSFFDKGFAIQDRGAGIYVSVPVDLNITPRTKVRVTGTLRDSFGLLTLVPDDPATIRVYGKGPKIHPKPLATGAVNEATEGLLVRVVATITQEPVSDLPFGFKFFVDDGSGELTIFVNTQTGIDLAGLAAGQTISVTGFSSQFDTHYEIDPRFQTDLTRQHR